MSEILLVYLWTRLDSLLNALRGGAVLSAVGALGLLMACQFNRDCGTDENAAWCLAKAKIAAVLFPCFVVLAIFVPNSKQMAYMVGTYYAVNVAKSDEGQKVMSLLRKKANMYLDEQLKETK